MHSDIALDCRTGSISNKLALGHVSSITSSLIGSPGFDVKLLKVVASRATMWADAVARLESAVARQMFHNSTTKFLQSAPDVYRFYSFKRSFSDHLNHFIISTCF